MSKFGEPGDLCKICYGVIHDSTIHDEFHTMKGEEPDYESYTSDVPDQ